MQPFFAQLDALPDAFGFWLGAVAVLLLAAVLVRRASRCCQWAGCGSEGTHFHGATRYCRDHWAHVQAVERRNALAHAATRLTERERIMRRDPMSRLTTARKRSVEAARLRNIPRPHSVRLRDGHDGGHAA